jgi:3-phosphoshikimate 1-carboxyvinyltransferase
MSFARFEPSAPLRGSLAPPPDKSISHRAALIGAMSDGETRVARYLDAADTRSTLDAVTSLGAPVTAEPDGENSLSVTIGGLGLRGPAPGRDIDVGNAGTLLRILPGWLAGQETGAWTLDGDESIRRRPVDRVAEPLQRMGASVECRDGRLPPLRIEGSGLRGIAYELPVASAQVKSCVLVAGLLAHGRTEVIEPYPTRDHTERILARAGVPVQASGEVAVQGLGSRRVSVSAPPGGIRLPGPFLVPGDFSSAAFFLAAATLVSGSRIRLEGVGLNPTRLGLLSIANRMGARVEVVEEDLEGIEPLGALEARATGLRATRVNPIEIPSVIDELPLVALLGCFAEGETVVTGAAELRHKESDRIAAVVEGLSAIGADIEALEDGFAVRGTGGLRGGTLDAAGDHRMAMLGAVAGLASSEGVEVRGMDATAVSYPGFDADLRRLLGG